MTQANRKGGYIKTLEINREGSSKSFTSLKDSLIKKADNYVCQVSRFITNTTPNINLVDEVFIEILRRPHSDDVIQSTTIEEVVDNGINPPDSIRQFRPKNYKTVLELARKLESFF